MEEQKLFRIPESGAFAEHGLRLIYILGSFNGVTLGS